MLRPAHWVSGDSDRDVVLITGCGSGLGRALAREFYRHHEFRVAVTARSEADLSEIRYEMPETDRFVVLQLDVINQSERESLIAGLFSLWRAVDIVINNAGISYRSTIEHMDEESEIHQLGVNYLAPMALIRLVIPSMRERGYGQIINVSSVSGMMAIPTMASYSASKHALEGATEALWYELRPFGIKVSLIQPGFIRSNLFLKVYFSKKAKLSQDLDGPYADYYSNMGPWIKNLMEHSTATPEKISKKILAICLDPYPPLWVPVTLDSVLFSFFRKVIPRCWFHQIINRFLPGVKNWGGRYRLRYKFDRIQKSESQVNKPSKL